MTTVDAPHRLAPGPLLPVPSNPRWKRLRQVGLWLGVLVGFGLLLIVFRQPLLTGYARLFVVNDPAPSDAIVLLIGGADHRPEKAAQLYKEGMAPVILMGDTGISPSTGSGETKASLDMLLMFGVPARAIRILPGHVSSTREEAMAVRQYVRTHPIERILLVTTAFHTRRTRWIFRKELDGLDIDIRTAAVRHPDWTEDTWYHTDEGLVTYVNETLKTLYYWVKY